MQAPVIAVTIRGTDSPTEVRISWTAPSDAASAGVRVVVVRGRTPTADPADPAAVLREDIAVPTSTLVWSGGTPGEPYTASAFAYDSAGAPFAAPVSAHIDLPAAVKRLAVIPPYRESAPITDSLFITGANADKGVLCFGVGVSPARPRDAAACGEAGRFRSHVEIPRGVRLEFVVFGLNSATGIYGPPVAEGSVGPPPVGPSSVRTLTRGATSVDLSIEVSELETLVSTAGTVAWEVAWIAGTTTPVGSAGTLHSTIPVAPTNPLSVSATSFRLTGLTADMPYTYAVRGIDSDGNGGEWTTPRTFAASVPSAYVVERAGARISSTRVPTTRAYAATSTFAVQRDASVITATRTPTNVVQSFLVRPAGASFRPTLRPPSGVPRLLTASRTTTGRLAALVGDCVWVRTSTTGWTRAGCAKVPRPVGEYEPGFTVHGLEFDNRGAVHLVYSGVHPGDTTTVNYATNAYGGWRIRRVLVVPEVETRGSAYSVAFTHDPVTDAMVLAVGTGRAFRVASKPAHSPAFAFAVRPVVQNTAYVPMSITSYAGRITVAATPLHHNPADRYAYAARDRPVVLTGTSPARVGGAVTISGTSALDAPPALYAQSATRVFMAWTHTRFDVAQQGAWTAWRTYGRAAAISRPLRVTRSAYDRLTGVAVDRSGRAYVLVDRQDVSIFE